MTVPSFSFLPISQVESCAVSWLWDQRLALGKLAILDGDPGLGKSLVALDLCARLSTGRPMPDGSPSPPWRICRGQRTGSSKPLIACFFRVGFLSAMKSCTASMFTGCRRR